jgi:UDP:flavonoid glycosyltransferase YjiC (YdhE family)
MHISIIAYGTWGDVRPSVALGRALQRAGHGVRLVVTGDFGAWVKEKGLDYHLLPVNKKALMRGVSSRTHPFRVMPAIRREIGPAVRRVGDDLLKIAGDTDALLVNEWTVGAASGIAEAYGLKMVLMFMQPNVKTRRFPISTMPPAPEWAPFRERYNLLTYELAWRLRWFTYGRGANPLREDRLRLDPLSARDYVDLFMETPSVSLISDRVLPRPRDWGDHQRMTGFVFFDDEGWQPPRELMNFLGGGPRPIYFGFGSMHDQRPREATRMILEALNKTRQRGVIYSGWAGLGDMEMPESIYRLDYAPHTWLFPRMAAVVHHAGAGTTAAALRAGVPSVPIPYSGDQGFWARRLRRMGAAPEVLPRARLSAAGLAALIRTAVEDEGIRRRAGQIGSQIRAERGLERTVAGLEELFWGQG